MNQNKTLKLFAIIIGFLLLSPILYMIIESLKTEQGFSFYLYSKLLDIEIWHSFRESLYLAFLVAISTTIIGISLAILLGKTTLRFTNFFLLIFIIPLLIPPYILAYSWFELIGRDELLFSFWGVAFILFWVYLPIPILLGKLFLEQIEPKLEESALLFSNWWRVLRYITLPLIAPAIVFSFLLVFILAFGEFSVANFFRYPIFPMESFTQFSAFYDFKMATVTAMPMVVIALVILIIESLFFSKNAFRFKSETKIKKIELGRAKTPILLSIFVLILFIILPLSTLIVKTDIDSFLIAIEKGYEPLIRSLIYASIGATVLTILGFLGAYMIGKFWRGFESILLFSFIIPSSVIGIGLILFWNRPYTNFVYTTPLIIILGYFAKYLFLTTKIIEVKLSQIPKSLIESAQLTGASWWRVVWSIILPLSRKSLIIAWIIGFIFSLRETTITMLVYPAGSDTLPLYIFTQMANGEPEIIASLSLVMVGVVLIFLGGYFLIHTY